MTTLEGVDRLGRLYDWAEEERDHVAALVAQARADGIEEGRGDMEHLERKWRAEERERIHDEIADRQHSEIMGNIPPAGSPTQAYDYARRIARGSS